MSNTEFAIAEVMPGKLNAMVKNIMKQMDITDPKEAVRRINSGEWIVSQPVRKWREEDGVIYFSVTSDGTTGPQWIERLEGNGFRMYNYTRQLLMSEDFEHTTGIKSEIAVLKGLLFRDNDRITKRICTEAEKRKLTKPTAEIVCLIRENFTDEEIEAMGLMYIVTMHEPIKNDDSVPGLLYSDSTDGGRRLTALCDRRVSPWDRKCGFAFVAPQVSPQT